jgi:hypothetical protein
VRGRPARRRPHSPGNLGYAVALVERDTIGGDVIGPTLASVAIDQGRQSAADTLANLRPDVLRGMRLRSAAHRIPRGRLGATMNLSEYIVLFVFVAITGGRLNVWIVLVTAIVA